MDPRSGKPSPATYACFAGGLACLLASATAFYTAIDTAASNKAALTRHTEVLKRPAYAFRPRALSPIVDGLAFGGLAIGLAALTAGLARARRERRSPYYRIGTAPGVQQPVEQAPSEDFPLVAPSGDDFVFNYGEGLEGELIVDGASTPLAELAASGRARPSAVVAGAVEIPIPASAKIRARAGQTTFLVSAVARPKQAAAASVLLEGSTLKYGAGSLAAHLAIVFLLYQVAVEDTGANLELAAQEQLSTFVRATSAEPPPPPEEQPQDAADTSGDGASEEAARMALEEGKAGDPDVAAEGGLRIKDQQVEPRLSREAALEAARSAGPLGSTMLRDSIASMASSFDFSSGFDDSNIYGGIGGPEGAGNGSFGMGRTQFGPGGGCLSPPCGIVGTGRYMTRPIGGDRYWPGTPGNPSMRSRDPVVPKYTFPEVAGTLDRTIVKRYIKRNEAAIGYCYEKELLARPGIAGTVTIRFLITANGSVQGSGGDGFDDRVASCVAGVIGRIAFPAPKDGGNVAVTYPFTFRAAGVP